MRRLLLLLPVLLLGFAPAPFPRPNPATDDQKAIQGDWKLISRTYEGGEEDHIVSTLEVKGNRWAFCNAESSFKSPFIVSFRGKRRPWFYDGKSGDTPVVSMEGIYKVEGDTLIICYITDELILQNPATRPLDFEGGKPGTWLDVFTRKKP